MKSNFKFIFYFLLGSIFFLNLSVGIFAGPLEDEEKLKTLLIKRDKENKTGGKNAWTSKEIQSVFQRLKEYYEPLAKKGDSEAYIQLGTWIALVEDGEEGLKYILPFAHDGDAYAQYLAGAFLSQMDYKPEAMAWYGLAAIQGHVASWENLLIHANKLNDPYAIYELSRIYHDQGDFSSAADCLERVLKDKTLSLPNYLTRGYIQELKGNFCGALGQYRKAGEEESKPYLEAFFQNPKALIGGLKGTAFREEELTRVEDTLLACLKDDQSLLPELKNFADRNLSAAYICGLYLSENKPNLTEKNGKRTGKKKRRRKKKGQRDEEALLNKFIESTNFLKFAAKEGHKRAQAMFAVPKNEAPQLKRNVLKKEGPTDKFTQGQRFEKEGKLKEACEAYELAWAERNIEACLPLGRVYLKRYFKEDKDATKDLAELPLTAAKEVGKPEASYYLGKLKYHEKEFDQAKEHWEDALNNGIYKAAYRLGLYYTEVADDKNKAYYYFTVAGQRGIFKAYYVYGCYLLDKEEEVDNATMNFYLGAMKKHKPSLEKLIELAHKKIPEAVLNYVVYLLDNKDAATAKKYLKELESIPNHGYEGNICHVKGRIARLENNNKNAMMYFEKGGGLGYTPSLFLLGTMQKEQGELDKALATFQKLIKIEPEHKEALYLEGLIYEEMKSDLALYSFSKCARLGHDMGLWKLIGIYIEKKSPLVALHIGSAYLANNKPKGARKYWRNAFKTGTPEIKQAVLFNLTQSYVNENDVKNAAFWAQQAITQGEEDTVPKLQEGAHSTNTNERKTCRNVLKKLGIPLLSKDALPQAPSDMIVSAEL